MTTESTPRPARAAGVMRAPRADGPVPGGALTAGDGAPSGEGWHAGRRGARVASSGRTGAGDGVSSLHEAEVEAMKPAGADGERRRPAAPRQHRARGRSDRRPRVEPVTDDLTGVPCGGRSSTPSRCGASRRARPTLPSRGRGSGSPDGRVRAVNGSARRGYRGARGGSGDGNGGTGLLPGAAALYLRGPSFLTGARVARRPDEVGSGSPRFFYFPVPPAPPEVRPWTRRRSTP